MMLLRELLCKMRCDMLLARTYNKNGLSFNLPWLWKVFDDYTTEVQRVVSVRARSYAGISILVFQEDPDYSLSEHMDEVLNMTKECSSLGRINVLGDTGHEMLEEEWLSNGLKYYMGYAKINSNGHTISVGMRAPIEVLGSVKPGFRTILETINCERIA